LAPGNGGIAVSSFEVIADRARSYSWRRGVAVFGSSAPTARANIE
jgi:hypothetical protein